MILSEFINLIWNEYDLYGKLQFSQIVIFSRVFEIYLSNSNFARID